MLEWWGPVIWEYYAATEGGGTIAPPDEWIKYPGTVGRAWPTSELKITDDDGNVHRRPASPAPCGCGWARRRSSTRATRRRRASRTTPRATSPSATSAYLNEDGYLFLCDRKSDMIIAGGVNIYPAEIEGVIHEHPEVADVAVFGVPDDDMGEQIKAVVEPIDGCRRRRRAARVDHGARPAASSASTSGRARSTSSTSCRASRPASC